MRCREFSSVRPLWGMLLSFPLRLPCTRRLLSTGLHLFWLVLVGPLWKSSSFCLAHALSRTQLQSPGASRLRLVTRFVKGRLRARADGHVRFEIGGFRPRRCEVDSSQYSRSTVQGWWRGLLRSSAPPRGGRRTNFCRGSGFCSSLLFVSIRLGNELHTRPPVAAKPSEWQCVMTRSPVGGRGADLGGSGFCS